MARKRYSPERIVGKLRAIEVHPGSGMTREQAGHREEISVQTYFRWRKEYGGMKTDQAKRLKELEEENARLKKLLAEARLDEQVLEEVARGRFSAAQHNF